jgi:pyrroloquinoline quinone biosynthesis protein B
MSEIPHPFVVESAEFFKKIKDDVDINFIHFNHTNPLLNENSESRDDLKTKGFSAASLFQRFDL